jgi:phosphohistidine phosphatase SixA
MPLILVRHASAGDRRDWVGDDRERPLDARGERQARELVERLEPFRVEAIHTSPARRCVQTVQPLAEARGLELSLDDELGEDRQATEGAVLVRRFAGGDVVVCGHGGLEAALHDPPRWRKAGVFVVDDGLRVIAER